MSTTTLLILNFFLLSVGALEEELVLNDEYEDHYESLPSTELSHPRQAIKSGPQSVAATAINPDVSLDCDFYTSELCIDVDTYPR